MRPLFPFFIPPSPPYLSSLQKQKKRKKSGKLTGMMITASGSHTLADSPNSFWKMPKVPGPHTSCVISLSTLVQTLSPGRTERAAEEVLEEASESMWLERIFSVMVMARLTCLMMMKRREREEEVSERSRSRERGKKKTRASRWQQSLFSFSLSNR